VKEKPFNKLVEIFIVSAMGPPGGGRSVITPRIQRHFNVLTYTDLQFASIEVIFNTILKAFYARFAPEIRDAIGEVVSMTLRVYD